jgi:hypothetical protein
MLCRKEAVAAELQEHRRRSSHVPPPSGVPGIGDAPLHAQLWHERRLRRQMEKEVESLKLEQQVSLGILCARDA